MLGILPSLVTQRRQNIYDRKGVYMKKTKTAVKQKNLKKKILARWQLYLLLGILVAYFLVFYYYPMFGIQLAFKKFNARDGIWGSDWIGLANFKRFFSSYYFERTLTNTVRISLYSLIAGFPLPVIFALVLNCMRNQKYKKFVQMVTYMPHFISTVLIVGMLNQFLNPVSGIYGVIYSFVTGDYSAAPDLLGKANAFPHLYVWSGVWQEIGWNSIIYIAALAGVDAELYEAATIDGATRFKRVLYIDIPCIVPTIVTLLILRCGSVMSVGFEKAFLMQNNLNLVTSEVISTYAYKVSFNSGISDFGLSTAIGLFNNVINLIMLLSVNYISKKVSENSLW